MIKKTITGLLIFGFLISLLFLSSSCTKEVKQAPPTTSVNYAKQQQEKEAAEAARKAAEEKAREKEAAQKVAEEKARAEAEAKQALVDMEAEKIYFDFNKSELKPEARAILTKKATWLKAHPEYDIKIAGNCDERGTEEYNLALGERRAVAAEKFLSALGVYQSRISTVSYGALRPAVLGHNEAAWAKNRRDEFTLIKK